MKRVALLLILGCAVVLARNVVITNPTTQPIPIKQVASSAPVATPTASPVGTATATPTATASAGTGLADGDPVSSWVDSSGAGHNATQSGTARPIFKTNVLNGKPVVRFTSAGLSGLNIASPFTGAAPWTAIAVFRRTGSNFICLGGTTAAGAYAFKMDSLDTLIADQVAFNNWGQDGTNAAILNQFHVISSGFVTPGGGLNFYIDGTFKNAGGAGSANSNNFTSIGYRAADSLYTDGDIAEIVFYNGTLALRTKLVLLLTALITTGEFPSPAEFDAMVGHRDKIKKYLHKHGAHPTKAQLDAVVTPMAVGDRANIEKYLGTKYGITVAGGTAADPSTVAGLTGWWKADSLSSFDPTMLAGLKGWWQSDAVRGYLDGNSVATWPDSSGNSNTSNTMGSAAQYRTNIINGHPVMRWFLGSAFQLSTPLVITSGWTIFSVQKPATAGSELCSLGDLSSEGNSGPLQNSNPSGTNYYYLGVSGIWYQSVRVPDANWHVLTGISSAVLRIDGAVEAVTNIGGAGASTPRNVMGFRTPGTGSEGDFAEILAYQGVLSTTDIQKVEAYLKAKYAIP